MGKAILKILVFAAVLFVLSGVINCFIGVDNLLMETFKQTVFCTIGYSLATTLVEHKNRNR